MDLGDRVQSDRVKLGATQASISEKIVELCRERRFRDTRLAKMKAPAIRAWLAKLETGRLRAKMPDPVRDLLCAALKPKSDRVAYRELPLQSLPVVVQPNDPHGFKFEEMWVFSSQPLELRDPNYASYIIGHWGPSRSPVDRPAVYFVPGEDIARELVAAFIAAAGNEQWKRSAVMRNLHVEMTRAASLMPHWLLRFRTDRDVQPPVFDGWIEEASTPLEGPRSRRRGRPSSEFDTAMPVPQSVFAQMPHDRLVRVINAMKEGGIVGSDHRYVPGSSRSRSIDESVAFEYFDKKEGQRGR